jgi:hypothetical protein
MTLSNTAWQRLFGNDLVINTSRIEGVAPLGVSFDVVDTVFADADTLMLAEFMWDFGDTGTANETGTDDEYNVGKGYAVSHVYREVGTYTATVSAYWGEEQALASTASVTIEVSEFSGTTYYISADGSDSNDGLTEETPLLTLAHAIDTYLEPSTQFLLRQGDTFSQDTGIVIGEHGGDVVSGPVHFGSYEDANSPSDLKPILYDTRDSTASVGIFAMLNVDDFRFVNLKLEATGGDVITRDTDLTYPSGFTQSSVTPSTNCLFLDCDVKGCGSISFHTEGENHIVQDCTVRDGGSYGVYMDYGTNCAFIGMSMKEFSNDSPEYTMRLSTGIVKNYVAYCDLWGDYTKCTFQVRGDDSSYNYVWNNQFDRFAGINQTNNEQDETLHHNTFDSNITVMRDYEDNTSGSYEQTGFFFSSNYSMFRNNIVYGFTNGFALNVHDIVGGTKHVWVHNNTVIGTKENSCFLTFVFGCEDIELRNNIFYNLADTVSYSDRFINITSTTEDASAGLLQVDSDYNIFIGEAWGAETAQTLVGVPYSSEDPKLADWQSTYGNDVNSYYADALLNLVVDTDDVTTSLTNGFATVGDGSPAIDAGDSNIRTKFDFFNKSRTDKTMGAIV